MKFKRTKCCVLSSNVSDNTDADPNNIIFNIKDTKLCVPVVALSAKDNQKLSKLFSKTFERSIGINMKQKVRIKIQKTSIDISFNQTL